MNFFGSVIKGVKPLAQGAAQAGLKAGRAVVDDIEGGAEDVKSRVTNVVKSGFKGKLKGRGFGTKNIRGSQVKRERFQKFARASFTGNKLEGVIVEDPSGTGLYRYDSNAVPYDSFNRNEVSRRMNRPFRFSSDILPYGRSRQ